MHLATTILHRKLGLCKRNLLTALCRCVAPSRRLWSLINSISGSSQRQGNRCHMQALCSLQLVPTLLARPLARHSATRQQRHSGRKQPRCQAPPGGVGAGVAFPNSDDSEDFGALTPAPAPEQNPPAAPQHESGKPAAAGGGGPRAAVKVAGCTTRGGWGRGWCSFRLLQQCWTYLLALGSCKNTCRARLSAVAVHSASVCVSSSTVAATRGRRLPTHIPLILYWIFV